MRAVSGIGARLTRAIVLSIATAAAGVASAADHSAHEHQAHGHAPEEKTPQGRSTSDALYTPDELRFLTHMIVHHQQALEMSALVPARSGREEFVRFARYIESGQAAEIAQMRALLDAARERGIEIPDHPLHGDPPMNGMLSSVQMKALEEARGAEFEQLWLEGMIRHHQGAIDMALEQQQRRFESGRRPFGIDVLLDDILSAQRAEIAQMREWLAQWRPGAGSH